MALIDKVIVWQRTDGGVSVTYLDDKDKLNGESEDDFIARMETKLQGSSGLQGASKSRMNRSDVPGDRSNRNKWRVIGNKVQVDNSVVLPEEVRLQKLNSAKAKLKAGQPLSEEEASVITGV